MSWPHGTERREKTGLTPTGRLVVTSCGGRETELDVRWRGKAPTALKICFSASSVRSLLAGAEILTELELHIVTSRVWRLSSIFSKPNRRSGGGGPSSESRPNGVKFHITSLNSVYSNDEHIDRRHRYLPRPPPTPTPPPLLSLTFNRCSPMYSGERKPSSSSSGTLRSRLSLANGFQNSEKREMSQSHHLRTKTTTTTTTNDCI